MPEITGDSALFRQQMRKSLLAARAAMPLARRESHARAVMTHLRHWLGGPDSTRLETKSIGFCLPWRDECDLLPLLTELAAAGWSVSVPVVTVRAQAMVFRRWQPDAPIGHDSHGVPIPVTDESPPPALLLLPVVGVDARGYRLGYGGGYFDRTLAALTAAGQRPLCIGIGFSQACINDLIPETHDQALDLLVTEAGLTNFAAPRAGQPGFGFVVPAQTLDAKP